MKRITKTVINDIDPKNEIRERDIVDAEIRGFGVRIRPKVDPTFYFRYQSPKTRKIRRISIGSVKDIKLDDARELARSYRNALAKGVDPTDARRNEGDQVTVQELYDRYLAKHVDVRNKPRTKAHIEQLFNRWVLPKWKAYAVAPITEGDAHDLIAAVKGKTVANRTRAYLSKMFGLAETWKYRPRGSNPFKYVPKHKEGKKSRRLLPHELAKLWKTLCDMEERFPQVTAFCKVMLLTGCRPNEVMEAELKNLDRARNILILPDSKTGEAEVELADEAIQVIDRIQALMPSPWLIPGVVPKKRIKSPYGAWWIIRKAAGLDWVRLYDLRHAFGTYSHNSGATQRQIMDMMRHTTFATSGIYIHGSKEERRQGAQKTVSKIMDIVQAPDQVRH